MSSRAWLLAVIAGLLVACPLSAEERHQEFLDALREARLFDQAIDFLDQLEKRADVDPAIKETITYEKGMTQLDSAQYLATPPEQLKALDLATQNLQEFLKTHANHPKAANGSYELAHVLVKKGRVEVMQSKMPTNSAKKAEFQTRARGYFTEAKKTYQQSFDLYTKKLDEIGKNFIDKTKDAKRFAEREELLKNQIQAEFNLYLCKYDEAQTYDKTNAKGEPTPERKKMLEEAANDFEKLHQKHRSVVAGLYARVYQGKCFEEMGDLTKALGIYNEILGHGEDQDTDEVLERLKDHALHFKCICLNDEQKKDWQVVVDLATAWMKERATKAQRSSAGIGIRWEKARALEQLGLRALEHREKKTTAGEKPKGPIKEKPKNGEPEVALPETNYGNADALLGQAESEARAITRFPGEYKDPALTLALRVRAMLGKASGDPKDWDTAFGGLQNMMSRLRPKREEIAKATPETRAKLQQEYVDMVKESIRLLKLTLSLNGPVPEDKEAEREKQMNKVRYFLSYAYFSHPTRGYDYDAALLGEYIARKYPKSDIALDAAYLAMNCWQRAYAQSDIAKRAAVDPIKSIQEVKNSYEIQRAISICEFITQQWPSHDLTQDARIQLGMLYSSTRQPAKAAEIFEAVPKGTTQYLDAQLRAGAAIWDAYRSNNFLPEAERTKKEIVDTWPAKAKLMLETATKEQEALTAKSQEGKDPKDLVQDDGLTFAKLNLMSILNFTLDHAGAVKLLNDGKFSILAGVETMKGKKGELLKTEARREALRAYVGLNQVEKAREQLKELEKISGGGDGLTQILVELGKKLKEEIDQKAQANDPRLNEVLQSFEAFLGDLFARKDGQDFNSLVWIGQTFFSLGEGIEKSSPDRALTYFGKSGEAYQRILDRSATEPNLIPKDGKPGVQLRRVMAFRKQKKFVEAHNLVVEILKLSNSALDVQFEAAMIYEDQAAQGGPKDWEYYLKATQGDLVAANQAKIVWGWIDFGNKLRDAVYTSGAQMDLKKRTDMENKFFEVRYHLARCKLQYGRATPTDVEKEKQFGSAIQYLTLTSKQIPNFGVRADYARLNTLYREARQEHNEVLGKMNKSAEIVAVADLEKSAFIAPPEPEKKVAQVEEKEEAPVEEKRKPAKAAPKPAGTDYTVLIAVAVALLGGGGMVAMMFMKPKKPVRRTPAANVTFEGLAAPPPPPAKKKPARTKAP